MKRKKAKKEKRGDSEEVRGKMTFRRTAAAHTASVVPCF